MQNTTIKEGAHEFDRLRVTHQHSQAELAAKTEQIEALSEQIGVLSERIKSAPVLITTDTAPDADTRAAPHVRLQWVEETLVSIREEVKRLLENARVQSTNTDDRGRHSILLESVVQQNMEYVHSRIDEASAEARKHGKSFTAYLYPRGFTCSRLYICVPLHPCFYQRSLVHCWNRATCRRPPRKCGRISCGAACGWFTHGSCEKPGHAGRCRPRPNRRGNCARK
jgi:hypothetical protein